jgi:hypothetical protein
MANTNVSLDRYLASQVIATNSAGGRGYESGVRTFNCPLCHEDRARGWMNVERFTAGCWNGGCVAEPRIEGGAIEWIRLVEGMNRRAEVWRYLLEHFSRETVFEPARRQRAADTPDFCKIPEQYVPFTGEARSIRQIRPEVFVHKQWGLTAKQAQEWALGYCLSGEYSGRIIIPIILFGMVVAFQARAFAGATPKYLNSKVGIECARPMGSVLFNFTALGRGEQLLLVEGSGDVMRWHREDRLKSPHGVGLLGLALTPEKLLLLRSVAPSKILVGLDNDEAGQARAFGYLQDLEAWGFDAVPVQWSGGKDLGEGAALVELSSSGKRAGRVQSKLGRFL